MTTLYQRIGGEEVIERTVDRFYEHVLSDPLLQPFFANTSMDKLRRMQKEFFSIALDGPETDTEISLTQAHQGRGIEREHLTRFTEHLLTTLQEIGLEDSDLSAVIARIATYSDQILGESTVDG